MRTSRLSRWGWMVVACGLVACQSPAPGLPDAAPRYGLLAAAPVASTVVVFGGAEALGWPLHLADHWPGTTVMSLGRDAATVAQVRDELAASALAAKPTVAIVALGGSDLLGGTSQEDFKSALNTIAYRFRMAEVPLYIVDLPRLDRYPAFASEGKALKSRAGDLHDALKCVVRDQDATFVRQADWLRAVRQQPGMLEADGVTPTAAGYAAIAAEIADTVELPGVRSNTR